MGKNWMDLGIWTKMGKNQSVLTCDDFSKLRLKKSQVLVFGSNVGLIWLFQIFGYMSIWTKEWIIAPNNNETYLRNHSLYSCQLKTNLLAVFHVCHKITWICKNEFLYPNHVNPVIDLSSMRKEGGEGSIVILNWAKSCSRFCGGWN